MLWGVTSLLNYWDVEEADKALDTQAFLKEKKVKIRI